VSNAAGIPSSPCHTCRQARTHTHALTHTRLLLMAQTHSWHLSAHFQGVPKRSQVSTQQTCPGMLCGGGISGPALSAYSAHLSSVHPFLQCAFLVHSVCTPNPLSVHSPSSCLPACTRSRPNTGRLRGCTISPSRCPSQAHAHNSLKPTRLVRAAAGTLR